jgi:glycosyltransferase involved in cell wall biosynthesis
MSADTRVLIVHGAISPYRIPLFSELAKSVHLDVIFCEGVDPTRHWKVELSNVPFGYRLLRYRRLGLVVVNLGLWKALSASQPTVYILADNQENLLTLMLAALHARIKRKPIIIWSEQVPKSRVARAVFSAPYRPLVFRTLERVVAAYRRWLYRSAQAFASMSGDASDRYLEAAGISRGRIFTGTQVMPANLMPLAAPLAENLARHLPFLLFLGYLRPGKAVDQLIEAFLKAETGPFSLVVAGAGPDAAALRKRVRGVSRVAFVGHVDGETKASLLAGAAALVHPSHYEAWGLVVNESLFYGTPVLCNAAVAAVQLLSPASGMVFADSVELVDCITRFCGDPSLQLALRRGAAEIPRDRLVDPKVGVHHLLAAIRAVTGRRDLI